MKPCPFIKLIHLAKLNSLTLVGSIFQNWNMQVNRLLMGSLNFPIALSRRYVRAHIPARANRRVSTRFQPDETPSAGEKVSLAKESGTSIRRNLLIAAGNAPEGTSTAIDWALSNLIREGDEWVKSLITH